LSSLEKFQQNFDLSQRLLGQFNY